MWRCKRIYNKDSKINYNIPIFDVYINNKIFKFERVETSYPAKSNECHTIRSLCIHHYANQACDPQSKMVLRLEIIY